MAMGRKQHILTQEQIQEIFRQKRGAAAQLAADLGVTRAAISQALRGVGSVASSRLQDAIRRRAIEITAAEQGSGQSFGQFEPAGHGVKPPRKRGRH